MPLRPTQRMESLRRMPVSTVRVRLDRGLDPNGPPQAGKEQERRMTRNDAGSTGDEGAQPRRQRKTTQRAHATPPDDTFAAYMRDVSRHPLLTPEEERDLALGIAELRVGYWREVLSYAPYAEAATMLLEDIMEMTPALRGALEEVRSRANAARRSNKKTVRDAYATAADGAARALALADAECIGADRIAADLEQLSTGFARG